MGLGGDHVIRKNLFEDVGVKIEYDFEQLKILIQYLKTGFNSYNRFRTNDRDCKGAQNGCHRGVLK